MDIKLVHLSKVFADKDQSEVRAVDDLNIVVPSGKLIGLLGPSGLLVCLVQQKVRFSSVMMM